MLWYVKLAISEAHCEAPLCSHEMQMRNSNMYNENWRRKVFFLSHGEFIYRGNDACTLQRRSKVRVTVKLVIDHE